MDKDTQTNKLTLSVEEAAERLGVCHASMYQLIKTNGFPTVRVGKRVLISARGLESWVDERAGGKVDNSHREEAE